MTEELGPEAEERRRLAREDIQNRRSMLEEHRKRRRSAGPGSFDALVDDEGRLLRAEASDANNGSLANSTAVELATSQVVQRGGKQQTDSSTPLLAEGEPASSNANANASTDNDKLHVAIPPPNPQSATLINYTPTSEASEMTFSTSTMDNSEHAGQPRSRSSSSSRTEDQPETLFAHPGLTANDTNQDIRSPFSDLSELDPASFEHRERPSTPSSTSGFSHIHASADDTSDGTLSDLGLSTGAATPASWSEVGSVISHDDFNTNHHGL